METFNPVMQLAFDYVESTNTVIFLTGKAGTGKTTFLKYIKQHSQKKMATVAPTGVAAINAGGMTIHSFFQMPFGPIIPNNTARPELHYSPEKKDLLASLELLIIDEVSMVRPDVLDHIDLVLRNLKSNTYPFGGVQLLMIGDLSQLSPIIREEEWMILGKYYTTPYFYSSLVMQMSQFVQIELNQVFRQKEQSFVDILNEVRNQAISQTNLSLLNARYQPGFRPTADDPFITLTTHNNIAQKLNSEYLDALEDYEHNFKADIRGDFPKDGYPTEVNLKLKVGSQVMFVKNDNSAEKLYFNGKIGTVNRIEGDTVFVQCEKEIAVQALEWTNIKYQLDEQQINETNAGSFIQIPLKLAWAITIHKSQGLTFDKAIIDVSEAFAHGQVYVALSRCRTLSGLVLRNPVASHNIIGDKAIAVFNEKSKALHPDQKTLVADKERYRLFLLDELFDLQGLQNDFADHNELVSVSEKFRRQPHEPERTLKAATYFRQKLEDVTINLHTQIPATINQSPTQKVTAAKADKLIQWVMTRIKLMEQFSKEAFTTVAYLKAKAASPTKYLAYAKALNAKPNEKLYEQLLTWRNQIAEREKIMPNMILSERLMALIAEKLPETLKNLGGIKGVGKPKTDQYGSDIIELIRAYQQEMKGPEAEQHSLF